MELRGHERPAFDRRDKTITVLGPRHAVTVAVCGGVRMDEVETFGLDASKEHRVWRSGHGVPAHMRHDVGSQPSDRSGKYPDAVSGLAVFDAALVQHLHADTDAEH